MMHRKKQRSRGVGCLDTSDARSCKGIEENIPGAIRLFLILQTRRLLFQSWNLKLEELQLSNFFLKVGTSNSTQQTDRKGTGDKTSKQ